MPITQGFLVWLMVWFFIGLMLAGCGPSALDRFDACTTDVCRQRVMLEAQQEQAEFTRYEMRRLERWRD